jgi:hypothetical protein
MTVVVYISSFTLICWTDPMSTLSKTGRMGVRRMTVNEISQDDDMFHMKYLYKHALGVATATPAHSQPS